jgi:hypothetical protein
VGTMVLPVWSGLPVEGPVKRPVEGPKKGHD